MSTVTLHLDGKDYINKGRDWYGAVDNVVAHRALKNRLDLLLAQERKLAVEVPAKTEKPAPPAA
jgi:hypothetical protein